MKILSALFIICLFLVSAESAQTLDTSFLPGIGGTQGGVSKLTPQTDGKFIVTGDFSVIGGVLIGGILGKLNAQKISSFVKLTIGRQPVFDFDGDGKTDISIFRPSAGEWWLNRSSSGQTVAAQFGGSADKPVPADYTGDGKTDIAFWRPSSGEWYILRSEDGSFLSFPFGAAGDVPTAGDYDGDGRFDTAVFRPSDANWYVQRSTAGLLIRQFGASGDRPVPNAFVP